MSYGLLMGNNLSLGYTSSPFLSSALSSSLYFPSIDSGLFSAMNFNSGLENIGGGLGNIGGGFGFDMDPSLYSSLIGNSYIPTSKFSPSDYSYSSHQPQTEKVPSTTPKSINEAIQRAMGEVGQVGGGKYGESGKWCAAFASWAYGGSNAPWGDRHDVAGIKDWAVNNGKYHSSADTTAMKQGDLVVWRPETCRGKSHVGIVKSVNPDGSFTTVEGNSGNQVKTHKYSSSANFDGYVSMNKSYSAVG